MNKSDLDDNHRMSIDREIISFELTSEYEAQCAGDPGEPNERYRVDAIVLCRCTTKWYRISDGALVLTEKPYTALLGMFLALDQEEDGVFAEDMPDYLGMVRLPAER